MDLQSDAKNKLCRMWLPPIGEEETTKKNKKHGIDRSIKASQHPDMIDK